MSHFYASIQGNRGEATRCGTKGGMMGWIRGWHSGVKVWSEYNEDTNTDEFRIYATGGSGDGKLGLVFNTMWLIGEVKMVDAEIKFIHDDVQCALLQKD